MQKRLGQNGCYLLVIYYEVIRTLIMGYEVIASRKWINGTIECTNIIAKKDLVCIIIFWYLLNERTETCLLIHNLCLDILNLDAVAFYSWSIHPWCNWLNPFIFPDPAPLLYALYYRDRTVLHRWLWLRSFVIPIQHGCMVILVQIYTLVHC